jgi:hypothetical protein
VNKSKPDDAEGCIVPFVFDNGTGWVGCFCMNAPMRGLGWGGALFSQCLAEFEKAGAKMVGLDGVAEQVQTYERRGFKTTNIVRLMVRKGIRDQPLEGGLEHVETDDERLVPLNEVPASVLVENDLAVTGFKRGKLWSREAMFDRDDAWGLALVKEGNKEQLEGWVLVRSCQHGYRFGPLYANSKENAKFLLHQAMYRLQASDGSFIAEVWYSNVDAVAVFEESGWEWCNVDYHRMWLHGNVPGAQQAGGKAEKEMFAIFDAAQS